MDTSDPVAIQKEVRKYTVVFVALAALTGITVGASYIDAGTVFGVILALIIASIKASLVAGYFMHLISEKRAIYALLILTAIFFIALFLLPAGSAYDTLEGAEHVS